MLESMAASTVVTHQICFLIGDVIAIIKRVDQAEVAQPLHTIVVRKSCTHTHTRTHAATLDPFQELKSASNQHPHRVFNGTDVLY